jgi:translation initiation factor 3 subunit J
MSAQAAAAKAKAEAEAAAAKKSRTQRIAEHKEVRKQREEEEEDEESSDDEDEYERRARLRRTEKDADLKHAEDLFSDIDLNQNRSSATKAIVIGDTSDPTKAIDLSAMALFKPSTIDQFTLLTNTLIPLLTAHSKKPPYSIWVQTFAKQLVKDLPSAEVKKVATALTTLSNEKMKDERAADRGTKKSKAAKTKATLVTQRDFAKVDTKSYADDLGDDDFM